MAGLVIVGASYAGVQVAATAREAGYDGDILLLGDEAEPPYQRPPLSKGYLTGKVADAALPLRGAPFYAEQRIGLSLGNRATALDLPNREVHTAAGTFGYDHLVLATGSRARTLPLPGAGLGGVHVLRTLADATRLRDGMAAAKQAVVIGGGYIGLEVAASLLAVDSVNRPAEHLLARRLIAAVAAVPFEDAADPASDLRRFA